MRKPLHIAFWERVHKTRTCWVWTGPKNRDGYGCVSGNRAHRYSWELINGKIPKGLSVLHRCDNPPCVNPKHLWLGTQTDNVMDMVAKGRCADVRYEANPRAKLTSEQVNSIKQRVHHKNHHDGQTHKQLAEEYGVSKSTIDQSRGVIWKELINA